MYSTQGPSGRYYHHNSDFSGDVHTTVVLGETGTDETVMANVEIPFKDMLHLVLAHFRSKAVSFLEQADDATLEKFFTSWSSE
jgi:hypothetical protein